MNSIKRHLLLNFVLAVAIPLGSMALILILITGNQLDQNLREQMRRVKAGLELELTDRRNDLLQRALSLADNPRYRQTLISSDHQETVGLMEESLEVLRADVTTLIDVKGDVQAHGHHPGQIGKKMVGNRDLEVLNTGQPWSGFGIDSQGVAIQAIVPLVDSSGVLGVMHVARSIDYALIQHLSAKFGVELLLYHGDRLQATTITSSNLLSNTELFSSAMTSDGTAGNLDQVKNLNLLMTVNDLGLSGAQQKGRLVVLLSTADTEAALTNLGLWFASIAAALCLLAALASQRLGMGIVRPLRGLLRATIDLGKGNLKRRVLDMPQNEIGELAHGFNTMAGQLEKTTTSIEALNHEITERQLAETEARRLRDYQRSILDAMPSLIISLDPEGVVTGCNSRVTEDSGLSEADIIGSPVIELFPRLADCADFIQEAIKANEIREQPNLVSDTDSGVRTEHLLVIPLDPSGEVRGAVLRLDDVTARLELEEKLRQSEKMQVIGEIAGGVAHDFNNQLQVINSSAEIILQDQPDQNLAQLAEMIAAAGHRSAELTSQLLAFARRSPRNLAAVNLNKLLIEAESLIGHTVDKRITLDTHLLEDEALVFGDATQLQNALLNIMINACDAMPNGGTLSIDEELKLLSESECALYQQQNMRPGDFVLVKIADTGIGMSVDQLTHIFEPFFSTKEDKGTGLGLAAVHGTILQHNGGVRVESEEGLGTQFHIALPFYRRTASPGTAIKKQSIVIGSGHTLIVDDEELVAQVLGQMLQALGYDFTIETDAESALTSYEEHFEGIDLVLLDMNMPGISGLELFQQMKAINPGIQAMLCTGLGDEDLIIQARAIGIRDVIRKPFNLAELSGKIEYLAASRAS